MLHVILIAVVSLGIIALVAAAILFLASKKFAVYEDPRIEQITETLPGANCGGCGFAGCSALAGAIVKDGSLEGKFCPVGGQTVMDKVAGIMGLTAEVTEPKIAVVRCNGTCEFRQRLTMYDGAKTCAIAAATYGGETGCSYGCLGCGDCTRACQFDAIHMNPETGLPEVDEDKCTACGACVKACPKSIIELRYKGKKSRRVYVRCVNKDKGAVTRKACTVGCIGCGKCEKVCAFGAITIENNLSYIDYTKCKSCRKCVEACPTNAIIDLNFPPRKPKEEAPAKPAADAEKKAGQPVAEPKAAVKSEAKPAPKPEVETPKTADKAAGMAAPVMAAAQPEVPKDTVDTIKEAVADKVDDAKETINDIKEAVADKVDDAKETLQDIKEAVADKVDDAKDAIQDLREDVADKLDDLKEAVAEKVQDFKEDVKDAKEDLDEVVDRLKENHRDTAEVLHQSNPDFKGEVTKIKSEETDETNNENLKSE